MGIQLIRDKDPLPQRIGRHGLTDMGHQVLLGTGIADRRRDHLTGRHFKIGEGGGRLAPPGAIYSDGRR